MTEEEEIELRDKLMTAKSQRDELEKELKRSIASGSDRRVTITLTERQWDHVIMAMEHHTLDAARDYEEREKVGVPCVGIRRVRDRFDAICRELALQMGEEVTMRLSINTNFSSKSRHE